MWLTAREGHDAAALEAALEVELERVRTERVSDDELQRAKARLELGFLQGLETASGKAEQIGFYDTVLGDCGAGFARLEAYRSVTADELLAAAKATLRNDARTLVVVLPDGSAADGEEDDEDDEAGDEGDDGDDGADDESAGGAR
jgi:zinc protease